MPETFEPGDTLSAQDQLALSQDLALWAGLSARSTALVGFGLRSFIECAAATSLFCWRMPGWLVVG